MFVYRFSLPGLFFVSRSRDISVNMGKKKREKERRESKKKFARRFISPMNDIQRNIDALFVSHSIIVDSRGEQIERAKKKFSLSSYIRARKRPGHQPVIIFISAINISTSTFDTRGTPTDLPVKVFAIASIYMLASVLEHLLNRYPGPLLSEPLSEAWIYRFQVPGIFHRAPTHRANIPSNTFARSSSLRAVSSGSG